MPQTLTRQQDLRTGRSIWQSYRTPHLPYCPLTRDVRTDVLIVGAGISGAMIADALSDAGRAVLIADRRGPLKGSTSASTALLQYELDVPLSHLSKRIGRTRAERIWRRSRLAVDALRSRARHLDIMADLKDRDALELEGTNLDEDGLLEEAQARLRAGFEVTFLSRRVVRDTYGIPGRAALRGYDNLEADPRRLAAGFFQKALSRRARIVAPVEIIDLSITSTVVIAQTKQGPSIRAAHLVFATGYEFPRVIPQKGHRIISTWAIATCPQPRRLWPGPCLIWEASDPYFYCRATADGRIIYGGEDEPFKDPEARDELLPAKTRILERKLSHLFPQVHSQAEFAWCGSFGTTPTGTPSIGSIPRLPHCYAALGYGGNGITFSMMAAQMIRGMIDGIGDPDIDLVSFTRSF